MSKIFEVRESRTITYIYHVEAETEEEARNNYDEDYKVCFERTIDCDDRCIEVEDDTDLFYSPIETEEN